MANHAVLQTNKIAAKDIDAYVRPVVSASAIDNGNVFSLLYKSSTSGESQVWVAVTPATGSLVGLWMAAEPEIPSAYAGTKQYRGLGTIQDFYNVAGQVFTAIKPVAGDIITITAEDLDSSSTQAFAVASNGSLKFTWAAAPSASAMSLRYLATTYISLPDGGINNQRTAAFQFEVLSN